MNFVITWDPCSSFELQRFVIRIRMKSTWLLEQLDKIKVHLHMTGRFFFYSIQRSNISPFRISTNMLYIKCSLRHYFKIPGLILDSFKKI